METRGKGSKALRHSPKTQTYLVPLTGNNRPSFGVVKQDAVVEKRRVLGERRVSQKVMGAMKSHGGPPQGDWDHKKIHVGPP